jgi:hypothetical protein
MKPMPDPQQKFILLGSRRSLFKGPLPPRVSICHDRSDVEAAVDGLAKPVTWISFTRNSTERLLEKAVDAGAGGLRGSHLITLVPPRLESIPALLGLFYPVFGLVEGLQWLAGVELVEAIASDDAADRFIGGSVDRQAKTLTLLRGDVTALVAPFRRFPESGDGIAPDFARLRLTDYGRTIALGNYEASSDAVLYELDPDYRRRLKKRRLQSERTFGASLLRLRRQRRLKRTDFAPISSRAIARIERNEVEKPHAKTLGIIAQRLDVGPREIDKY